MARAATNVWFAIRHGLGNHRFTFPILAVLPGEKVLVNRSAQVCIGGFIRSGNTFAFHAFRSANPEPAVAHHVHASQQVRKAVRLGMPCIVLIREPLDAVTSLIVFEQGRLSPGVALRAYTRFHRNIVDLKDSIAICRFEDLLEEPAIVARRLNERFGTAFDDDITDETTRNRLLAEIEGFHLNRSRSPSTYSVPSAEKDSTKPAVRATVAGNPALAEAQRLYAELTRDLG